MPRTARKKSNTGIYHVILRGINRQTIFEDDEDAQRCVQTLFRYQEMCDYKLYAYCLMNNHVHLLIKEEEEDLGTSIKRIGASYVYWYNCKYERCGHLFQDRYKSETVEDDSYFLTVLRYIHQNPIKAKLVKNPTDYRWSSYRHYLNDNRHIDKDFALKLFNAGKGVAINEFEKFHRVEGEEGCLEVNDLKKWKDPDAIALIKSVCDLDDCMDMYKLDYNKQSRCFKILIENGLNVAQIYRLSGIGKSAIYKAVSRE